MQLAASRRRIGGAVGFDATSNASVHERMTREMAAPGSVPTLFFYQKTVVRTVFHAKALLPLSQAEERRLC